MVYISQISPDNIDVYIPLIPGILKTQALKEGDMRFYGISVDGEAAGTVVIRERADMAELRYMYLIPDRRGYGYMDKVLADLAFMLRDEGFSVITFDYLPSEYPAVARICSRFSFEEHAAKSAFFRFRVQDIRKCTAVSYMPRDTIKLRVLPDPARKQLYKNVERQGYDISHIISDHDVLASMEEHSLVYMEHDKAAGLILVQDMHDHRLRDKSLALGKVFPDGASADIALVYVGSSQLKAPLYLISALCRDILSNYEDNDLITGYFPEGQITRLLEGTLNIRGLHEMTASLSLDILERYDG